MQVLGRKIYRSAEIEIDTFQGCIKRNGQELYLRQKAFQLLVYLLEHHDRLVTKEELIENIWEGLAVTDDALVQLIKEVRRSVGDDPRQPQYIRTVPKAGYRFIGPVEEFFPAGSAALEAREVTTIELEYEEESDNHYQPTEILPRALPAAEVKQWSSRNILLGSAATAMLIAAIALTIHLWPARRQSVEVMLSPVPGKKTVAVMHFENLSGNPELDWLREGLTDMLITDLSRSQKLVVLSRQQLHTLLERIGRQSANQMRLEETLEIARRSQAEVMLTGSFARLGGQVRIDAQLHDARTGQLLAAEQLIADRPEQILTEVDLLSLKLASHLGAALTEPNTNQGLARVMTNSLDAYRYYSLALEQVQMYQFDEAVELLEKAVALDPQFALAYARIGYLYAVKRGRGEEAKPYLEKAFQLADRLSDKDRLYVLAWSASINHEPENAIQTYRQILAQYPLEVEAYEHLGGLLSRQEKPEEALLILKQGTVVDPERPDLYNLLGDVYLHVGNQTEARAALERYVALAPNDPNAYDSLASFHQWFGRYEKAIQIYQRALELNPESGVAILHLGHTYFQQGRYRAALEQYRRYLQVGKTDFARARGNSHLANLYLQKGELDRAVAAAKQVLKYFNQPGQFPSETLIVALAQGDHATVEKLKPKYLASLPASYAFDNEEGSLRRYYHALGYLALKEGKIAQAIENFKEALRHRALIWNINSFEDCLANAYLETGRLDEAIAEYERVLSINPNYPLAHYHLAQAYEREGEAERARAEYEQFLKVWKDADRDLQEVIIATQRLAAGT